MIKETSREHINFGGARAIPRETGIGFVLIILVGLALRLYGLGVQDLRYSEAAAYLTGTAGFAPLDPQLYGDNPPLYYDLIYFWTRLHESIWFARLFEALCGTAVIGAVYALTLRVAGNKAALFAAFIQAASPFAIFHSREAGADAFAQLLTVLALMSFERYLETGSTRSALAALTAQLLAAFSSYAALPLIPAMLIAVYVNRNNQRGIWGEWLALQGIFLTPVALWIYSVFEGRLVTAMENLNFFPSNPDIHVIIALLNTLAYGYFLQHITAWFLMLPLAVLALAGIAVSAGRRLFIYFFVPLLLMTAFINGFLSPRHLFVFTPVLAVLAGAGFAVLNFTSFRAIAVIWVSAGLVAGSIGYYTNDLLAASPNAVRKEFSRTVNYLYPRLSPGGTLYHAGEISTAPMAALQPNRWHQQWLMPDSHLPRLEMTSGMIAPRPYGNGPVYPAWVIFSSAGTQPFRDMEPAAVRYQIERSATPAEMAHFKGIAAVRYIPYETGYLDRIEDESGGTHLLRNRQTGEDFPANYRSLRPFFTGTVLSLTPGGELEVNSSYREAVLALTVIDGYPLLPGPKVGEKFTFASDGYANSFCFKTTVSPQQTAVLPLTTAAPAGYYRIFARVMCGSQGGALQAFADQQEVTAHPVILDASQTTLQWLNLGAVSYDGLNSLSIHVTSPDGQSATAGIQSVFLIPVDGGKLYRKYFTTHKGEPFHLVLPRTGLPLTAFLSDDTRGELLSVSLAR